MTRFSVTFLLVAAILPLAGCSDNTASTGAAATTTGSAAVATLQISGTPTTVKSDNSNTTTITVTALSASNAAVSNATIALSADTGFLSAQTLTTDTTGKATATFSSGSASKSNRTATITAVSGAITALLPVQIVGSTLTLTQSGTSLPSSGLSPATLTLTAKDAGGTAISGAAVTLTQTGSGTVTLTPASGTTNASGQLAVSVAGATAGTVTVSATAAGVTATANFTVSASTATFGINQLTLNGGTPVVPVSPKTTAMFIGGALVVQVSAPAPTTSVTFATTIGTWAANGQPNWTAPVAAGVATATLNSTVAGTASVQVLDPVTPALSDSLSVGITASTAASITLQASSTVLPRSVGTTTGYSTLTAMVRDATGAPVGGAQVAFSIVAGTGTNSGETVSPVVVFTNATPNNPLLALGAATTTFTSGSSSSAAAGVQIRATVVGTAIATEPVGVNLTTSGNDVAIVIGGTAGSVAFGQATHITDPGLGGPTTYTYPMSVLVADANGSPAPLGTVVNISVWPIAWSTGSLCLFDADNALTKKGTFFNEDANENLILDAGEDGYRKFYASPYALVAGGTQDTIITPLNSYGGTVASTNPLDQAGTATTDANGVATFNLTYGKSSAIWVISRLRAQTVVQGSPAVGQLELRLPGSAADITPVCYLPPSPFVF
ncbi:MAG TPA: Ig-like domain-containing protein [Gallionella sp.]|nr:Ig-like domain-containing protein [Gallionella sp.]